MKNHITLVALGLFIYPAFAFALMTPSVRNAPATVDADTYTLEIDTAPGSRVTVLGGPAFVPPKTDSDEDGYVEVVVGLAQDQANVFSISAELEGEFSSSTDVTISEQTPQGGQQPQGDVTAPDVPVIDAIENPVKAYKYLIEGSTEADANIYVKRPDGSSAGSTQANSNGRFFVEVDLVIGQTNRFNISAEDAAYNVSKTTQAVIQAVQPDEPAEEPQDESEIEDKPEVINIPFTDIETHWAKGFIGQIYRKGIVSGKTATKFDPNALITRAELTKIALLAFGHEIPEGLDGNPFADVDRGAWFARYVQRAKESGIVSGYEDGFRPNQAISRAAALKILLEASGLDVGDYSALFDDVNPTDWFRKYVAFAQSEDIVGGYEDGTFRAGNPITRAEVAKIVIKIMEYIEDEEL